MVLGNTPGWQWNEWTRMRQLTVITTDIIASGTNQSYVLVKVPGNGWFDGKLITVRTDLELIYNEPPPGTLITISERVSMTQFNPFVFPPVGNMTVQVVDYFLTRVMKFLRTGNTVTAWIDGYSAQKWNLNEATGPSALVSQVVTAPPFDTRAITDISLEANLPLGAPTGQLKVKYAAAFIEQGVNLGKLYP